MKLQLPKNVRQLPWAAAMAATLLVASAAHADVESGKLVLSGFPDAAAGEQLIAGKFDTVIQKLAPHTAEFNADEVAASTNLCVAYVAAGRLDEAHHACDEAIKLARLDLDYGGSLLTERLAQRDALSLAYANRAVLTKLSGQ